MAMGSAGYSGTPLPKKLGIKPGHRVLLDGAPDDVDAWLVPLPEPLVFLDAPEAPVDVAILFATQLADLVPRFEAVRPAIAQAGGIWVAWPK